MISKTFYIILLIFAFRVYPQGDINQANFFPLQVGNKYQMLFVSYYRHDYVRWDILKDTLINDERFFRLPFYPVFNNDLFYRYDISDQKLWAKLPNDDTLRLAINFLADSGTIYTSYIIKSPHTVRSLGFYNKVIHSDTFLTHRAAVYYYTTPYYIWEFSENLGVTYHKFVGSSGAQSFVWEQYLKSCIIDTFIFNKTNLKIDTLYPVIDRPLDTFPFIISGKFSSDVPSLVNSWNLEIEHRRNGVLLESKIENFITEEAAVNFNDIEPGDKIAFKSVITDNSIFDNYDQYPDSGYVEITVLNPVMSVGTDEINFHLDLFQNYPNPFNPVTTINYTVKNNDFITLKIYDLLGKEIATLVNEEKSAGKYEVKFDIGKFNLSSGVYFYKLQSKTKTLVKKMIVSK